MTAPASRIVCAGCGARPAPDDPYPFRCPNAGTDDVDHVLRVELDERRLHFPAGAVEGSPFVHYRKLLHAYHVATAAGVADAEFRALVRSLDERVAAADGHGFRASPFERSDEVSDRLGFSGAGGVWIKDETGNVSGSHKARHLFGVLLWLELVGHLGRAGRGPGPDLAVASCGNAALAAAVVAAAGGRRLQVFVPDDANPRVVERLDALGATVSVCPRDGRDGDPCVRRLTEALSQGALPLTCQGNLNGLAVEGGKTLAWEIVSAGPQIDRLVVQVGGGALASACSQGFGEAVALGALAGRPRLDTVQTAGAWPLKRAYARLLATDGAAALDYAARHRSEFMWPWEEEPRSVAHGILDDETYDWLAVAAGMAETGGDALVVDEEHLVRANALGRDATGIDVDPTGTAGLAGLLALREAGRVDDDERVAVLFTGVRRSAIETRGAGDAELSRTRHPVAEGLRAG